MGPGGSTALWPPELRFRCFLCFVGGRSLASVGLNFQSMMIMLFEIRVKGLIDTRFSISGGSLRSHLSILGLSLLLGT